MELYDPLGLGDENGRPPIGTVTVASSTSSTHSTASTLATNETNNSEGSSVLTDEWLRSRCDYSSPAPTGPVRLCKGCQRETTCGMREGKTFWCRDCYFNR